MDDPGALRVSLYRFLPREKAVTTRWHWHNSMDVIAIMAGEVEMGLDGGDSVLLKPGDVLVQNGTNHRWTFTTTGAIAIGFKIGAKRVGVSPPKEFFG